MRSVWASIAYIFNIISLSPNEPGGALDQLPFLSDNDRPEMPIGRPRGPRFRPPSASSWADIECDYSAMAGYSLCSTDGDRSCWIQDSNHETNHPYNISTNYEKNWPIGITRKANNQISLFSCITPQANRPLLVLYRTRRKGY